MPGIIAFDVNETLLELSALDSHFQTIFGDPEIRREWFEQVLKLAFVSTIVGSYSHFGAIGRAALLVVEERRKKLLSEEQRLDILQTMRNLPAHPDVKEGFRRLRDRGWRLVALTNATLEAAEVQLKMQVCATIWNVCSRPIRFAASSPQRSHTKWRHGNSGPQPRTFYLWQPIRGTSPVPLRRDAGLHFLRGRAKCSIGLLQTHLHGSQCLRLGRPVNAHRTPTGRMNTYMAPGEVGRKARLAQRGRASLTR